MQLSLYQVDAFADRVFAGNPAAICPLESWLPDALMQSIAAENNLSETAFFVPSAHGFRIRWFTPLREVDLCGHATLAAAWVLFEHLGHAGDRVLFDSRSGALAVARGDGGLEMDFPAQPPGACDLPAPLLNAFTGEPDACLSAEDYILVFDTQEEVIQAKPNLSLLRELGLRGVAITARGHGHDFVVRFFAPKLGIDEDPVTGSAFTQLAPYWSGVLGKAELTARQVSARGGDVVCTVAGDRVKIRGRAVTYLIGTVRVPVA